MPTISGTPLRSVLPVTGTLHSVKFLSHVAVARRSQTELKLFVAISVTQQNYGIIFIILWHTGDIDYPTDFFSCLLLYQNTMLQKVRHFRKALEL